MNFHVKTSPFDQIWQGLGKNRPTTRESRPNLADVGRGRHLEVVPTLRWAVMFERIRSVFQRPLRHITNLAPALLKWPGLGLRD